MYIHSYFSGATRATYTIIFSSKLIFTGIIEIGIILYRGQFSKCTKDLSLRSLV